MAAVGVTGSRGGAGAGDRPRAVVDTSSLFGPSLRRDLQQAAQEGAFEAVWSPWIIAELNRVLMWDWIKRTGNDLSPQNRQACGQAAKAMMAILLPTFTLGAPLPPYPPAWEALSDHWDYPIWAAAKVSNAHYVISENRSDYPPPADDGRYIHENIEDITGRDFPAMLAGE